MKLKDILKAYNEYIHYCKKYRGCDDIEHWNSLKEYILDNEGEIANVTWHDMAGGFTAFLIQEGGNTLVIGNELFDGQNNVIEYGISLKAYEILQDEDFDFDLIPQQNKKIWEVIND